ncbi:LexA family protein [Acinetobacter bereziniae]|uniref:LexA family protein n=1 Tax=Acinetobacter bereziniae TaxID=106648 RepID=UPI00190034CB|nr:translesion error-prone DNA polymerase V autoproteolytic subunit [Acinetobacter bereziniae]MBJ9904044.1 translesion error-prone DNA polymerase V autoproteolytic subunit [Acinetobacter bereziniae]WMW72927.1 translesion error-prone DNA polymerase V autoproteolytic subunit [Acinetobacter bereziniae]
MSDPQILMIKNHFHARHELKDIDFNKLNSIQIRSHVLIPVALSKIAAGFPSPAQDYIDKSIDMNEHLIHNPEATFIVEVESLSMINVGISIGDELIVDRSLNAEHRDIIVAFIDSEFTVKRLMITHKMQRSEFEELRLADPEISFKDLPESWLKPENKDYKPIYPKNELIIWGVVSKVIKNFK